MNNPIFFFIEKLEHIKISIFLIINKKEDYITM